MKNVIVAMDQPINAMDILYNFVMTEAKPVAYFMDVNMPLQKTEKCMLLYSQYTILRIYLISQLIRFLNCYYKTHLNVAKRILRY